MKNFYFIILALCIMLYIFSSIRKNKLSVKTSFGWIIGVFGMLFLAIFPKSLDWLAYFIGVNYPPALFLTLCVVILFVIDFNNSKKIAEYQMKIIELAQHVTLLEAKSNKKKEEE